MRARSTPGDGCEKVDSTNFDFSGGRVRKQFYLPGDSRLFCRYEAQNRAYQVNFSNDAVICLIANGAPTTTLSPSC